MIGFNERDDAWRMLPNQGSYVGGGFVAATKSDDLRRSAIQDGKIGEIRVLRHHDEAVLGGMTPNGLIVRSIEAKQSNLARAREKIAQKLRKLVTQILIEQQLHAA